MAKSMTIHDFLTDAQIEEAKALFKKFKNNGKFAKECEAQIIAPNMVEINRKLGQQNSARFLAYACEHVFTQAGF